MRRAAAIFVGVGLVSMVGGLYAPLAHARPAKPKAAPAPASAPTVPSPRVVAAEHRYQEAMRAFEGGERLRARALFEVALADFPADHPLYAKTLYNLAFLAEGEASDPAGETDAAEVGAACRAERAYARYLDAAPATPEHERTRAQATTRQARLLERCEAERTPVTVAVTTEESAPEPHPAWALPVVGGGALLAVGAGVGLQYWSQAALDQRDRAYQEYLQVADRGAAERKRKVAQLAEDDAQLRVVASYVAFGLGAVLAGAATWLWLTAPDEPAPDATVTLAPGPDGVSLFGRF